MVDCEHRWDSDDEVRLCLKCGEVRTFPTGKENPRVVWSGRSAESDPLQVPWADKALIARVAKGHVAQGTTLKRLAELTGINMFLLRGWVGALSRGKKEEPAVEEEAPAAPAPATSQEVLAKPKKHKQIGRYYEENKELITADYKSMTLLALFKKWGITSSTWTKLRTAWGVPKKGGRRRPRQRLADQAPGEPAAATSTSKSPPEEMADLKTEVLYLRGYREAVRDIFYHRPSHEYDRLFDGHNREEDNRLARADQLVR